MFLWYGWIRSSKSGPVQIYCLQLNPGPSHHEFIQPYWFEDRCVQPSDNFQPESTHWPKDSPPHPRGFTEFPSWVLQVLFPVQFSILTHPHIFDLFRNLQLCRNSNFWPEMILHWMLHWCLGMYLGHILLFLSAFQFWLQLCAEHMYVYVYVCMCILQG